MNNTCKKLMALLAALVLLSQLFALSASAMKSAFLGDINMDSALDPADARLALRIAIGLDGASTAGKKLADVDSDREVTPADARLILRAAVGLDAAFKIQFVFTDAELNDGPKEPAPTQPAPTQPYPQVPVDPGKTDPVEVPSGNTVPKPVPSSKSGTFTFVAYGWGDGVGMPQFGAVSMAKEGYTCEQILKHYFTGVKLVTDYNYPSSTYYLGDYYNTDELIARMVYGEMYGIVDENPSVGVEALKAQAVCLFTLLKYHDFSTSREGEIGWAPSSKSYSSLPEIVKSVCREVRGQYLTMANSTNNAPISALYGAISGGRTASAKDVWGQDYPYLQSVSTRFEVESEHFSKTFYFSKEEMYNIIKGYDSSIVLSDDPSQWIKVLSHSASIDADRGYVTKIQVGNRVMDGYFDFCDGMMNRYFWSESYFQYSTCFCVMYTP